MTTVITSSETNEISIGRNEVTEVKAPPATVRQLCVQLDLNYRLNSVTPIVVPTVEDTETGSLTASAADDANNPLSGQSTAIDAFISNMKNDWSTTYPEGSFASDQYMSILGNFGQQLRESIVHLFERTTDSGDNDASNSNSIVRVDQTKVDAWCNSNSLQSYLFTPTQAHELLDAAVDKGYFEEKQSGEGYDWKIPDQDMLACVLDVVDADQQNSDQPNKDRWIVHFRQGPEDGVTLTAPQDATWVVTDDSSASGNVLTNTDSNRAMNGGTSAYNIQYKHSFEFVVTTAPLAGASGHWVGITVSDGTEQTSSPSLATAGKGFWVQVSNTGNLYFNEYDSSGNLVNSNTLPAGTSSLQQGHRVKLDIDYKLQLRVYIDTGNGYNLNGLQNASNIPTLSAGNWHGRILQDNNSNCDFGASLTVETYA